MKKIIRKFLCFVILVSVLFLNIPVMHTSAAGTKYISANISVVCEENGNAHINETWEINATSDTEMYLERKDFKNQTISNLKVSADGIEYQTIKNWNTKASFEEKAYKCGIIKAGNDYELCWGLSSYGTRKFDVSYDITNMVRECSDSSFIEQVFIDELPSTLKNAKITIQKKNFNFTNDNTKIWAGGGAVGDIFIIDGKIEAKLTSPMSSSSNFIILSQFDKGIFNPKVSVNKSFQTIKEEELEGTTYKKNQSQKSSLSKSLLFVLGIILTSIIAPIFAAVTRSKNKNWISNDKFRKEYKNPNYSREMPFNNDIFATYSRLKNLGKLKDKCDIIGVYILKWIQNHNITLTKVETRVFFKKTTEDALVLNTLDNNADSLEKELFDFMVKSSDENQILRKKDFEKWCKNNYSTLSNWLERYSEKGIDNLKKIGAIVPKEKAFLGFIKYTANELNELGIKLTSEMFGFKKYLEDFSIINEREAKEVELWEEYLIYAQLFGIADKVSKQFKNLYPKYYEEKLDLDSTLDIIFINNLVNIYTISANNAYINAVNAAAGQGGSFGGGGGFGGAIGGGSSGTR